MIRFECEDCGKKMSAPEKFAGKVARCPHCKSRVLVPEPEEEIIEDFEVVEAVTERKPTKKAAYAVEEEEEPPPPPRKRRRYHDDDVDDDEDDRPRRKKKRKKAETDHSFFLITALVLGLVFVGMTIAAVMTPAGAGAMVLVGAIPATIGTIWIRNIAWGESYGEYMACTYIPLYDTLFAASRWDEAGSACIVCWIGRAFVIVALIILLAVHKGQGF